MLPTESTLNTVIQKGTIPSKSYKMNPDEKTIVGACDQSEAMKQVINKILMTERYEYIIYPWSYGIEFADLVGQPESYVYSEAQRRITEALTQDDRIINCTDFTFTRVNKKSVQISFVAKTIFGSIGAETEVITNV